MKHVNVTLLAQCCRCILLWRHRHVEYIFKEELMKRLERHVLNCNYGQNANWIWQWWSEQRFSHFLLWQDEILDTVCLQKQRLCLTESLWHYSSPCCCSLIICVFVYFLHTKLMQFSDLFDLGPSFVWTQGCRLWSSSRCQLLGVV